MKESTVRKWIVGIFVGLYALVSGISTIHVIDFFELSNPTWLAVVLAIAFELGAAACLAAIVILDKTSRWLVWTLFVLITAMQMSGNMYYAYTHLHDFKGWIELFALTDEEPIAQKRILSFVSGGILPIVALGFIKSLVDYIRPKRNTGSIEEPEPEPEPEGDKSIDPSLYTTTIENEEEAQRYQMITDSPSQELELETEEKGSNSSDLPESEGQGDKYQKAAISPKLTKRRMGP